MNDLSNSLAQDQLVWLPEQGIGWYPVTANPYGANYWMHYREMDRTKIADKLVGARVRLAREWRADPERTVDVGIGGGRFCIDMGCKGWDVNPIALAWLHDHGKALNPLAGPVDCATFWDSLEHIHDPRPILANVERLVLVSMPIYTGAEHILRSKHFKKDEHCWYFTAEGLVRFMERQGFLLAGWNTMEQPEREDIETFAFLRADAGTPPTP